MEPRNITTERNPVKSSKHRGKKKPRKFKCALCEKIIMKHSLTKLATAAAIIIVAFISISYLDGSVNTSKVYAAMIEALHHVNTVHVSGWTTRIHRRHTTVGDKPYDTSERYPIKIWEWFTENGEHRMFEKRGPITVWEDKEHRYEYQANKDTLYIDAYKSPVQLSEKFRYFKTAIESEKTYKIKNLGIRLIDGKEAQGYQGERGDNRKEIWLPKRICCWKTMRIP